MKKTRRGSFSKEINRLVVASLGVAFFLVFAASLLLLFLMEEDKGRLALTGVGICILYLALYLFLCLFVTGKIKRMFLPLDRMAWGLLRDQVFVDNGDADLKALADSLRSQAERMSLLSRELKNTREDLVDASRESRMNTDTQLKQIGRIKTELGRICSAQEEIAELSGKIADAADSALLLEPAIKKRRDVLYERSREINEQIHKELTAQTDTETEFSELMGSYGLLSEMHGDAGELLESLYNEMTAMQTLSSQINLYVMNTALDISRAGSITVSAISALDEIKEMSAKINEKTDSVILLIIRVRNSLKLAMDQSGECRDKGEECLKSFSVTKDSLGGLSTELEKLSEEGALISEEAGRLLGNVYDVKLMEERQERMQQASIAEITKAIDFVNQWRRHEQGETV